MTHTSDNNHTRIHQRPFIENVCQLLIPTRLQPPHSIGGLLPPRNEDITNPANDNTHNTPLKARRHFRHVLKALQLIATNSRPDIAYNTGILYYARDNPSTIAAPI